MLARGELRLVGATTLAEYREHVERDAAFERRFQQVLVGEPSVPDTVQILRGLKERYASHHGVQVRRGAAETRPHLPPLPCVPRWPRSGSRPGLLPCACPRCASLRPRPSACLARPALLLPRPAWPLPADLGPCAGGGG